MNLIKKEYVKVLEWGFKLAYLLLGAASFNVFLYDSPIQPMLVKICLALGALTLAGRLWFFKSYIKTPHWWMLALFCASFLASIVSNRRYGAFASDFKWIIWTGMLFFLLYVCDGDRERKSYKKEFHVFAHIMLIYSFLASGTSLYLMTRLYHAKWYTASGELMLAGFQWGRLWGVYTDPNYGSVFSVAAILLCVYFVKTQKTWRKIPYVLVIAADYLYIIFSDSRTALVCMAVSVGFWILFTAVHKKRKAMGMAASVLAAFLFAGIFVGATSEIKSQYNTEIQKQINILDAANNAKKNTQNKTVSKPQTVGRKADLQNDATNGRLARWKSGIEVWKTKPLLGVGYNSFLPYVKEHVPQTYVINNSQGEYVSLHNEYVNILVYQGIVGLGIFVGFGIMTLYRFGKSFWYVKAEDRDYIGVLTSCILVIAIAMVFLMEGFYTNSLGAFVLWTFLGYLMHFCRTAGKVQ